MFTNRSLRVRTLLTLFLILCGWLPAQQPPLSFLQTAETATGSGRGVAHAQADPPTTPQTDDAGSTIFLPLIANNATPDSVTTPTAAPEKAFAQQLQALATLLADWEESVAAGVETADNRTALAQSKQTLTDLDRQVRTNFTAREAKLRTAALPDLILERHLDSVQRHDAAWQTLLDLLTTLETTTDPNALRTAIGSARDFLTGQQPQPLVQLPRNDDLASRKATVLPAVTFNAELPAVQAAATQALLSIPGNPPVAADLLPTIDLQLTPAITDLAASLGNSPLELYRYVKNNIAYEPYLGSRKGATATLAMQAGNSYDQASLLIALLRAAGIPARYVTGRAVVPAPQVNSWLGVDDVDAAAALLNMAGLQVQGYLMPSGQALEFNHIWVAAYLPYTNDRGGPDDTGEAQWIPLDPSMKTLELRPGLDIPAAMNFNATAFVDSYISTFHTLSPVELYLDQIEQYAATNHPTLTYPDDIIRQRRIVPDPLPQLPASLPYLISSQSADFAEIPATQRYQIDFELRDGSGNTLFLYTADLPTIADKRVTLAYDPATSADQALLDLYGDLYATPPDLIYLKPVLRIGGVAVAQGGRVRPGDQHIVWHTFDPPSGEVIGGGSISHRSVAGEYHGIAFDPYRVHLGGVPPVSGTPDTDGLLGEQLYRTAVAYLDRQGQSWELTADTMQVVYATSVAQAVVTNALTVWYTLGGNPVIWDPEGLNVDAQNKTVGGAFSVTTGDSELIPFMTLVGADGSILENRVFEDLYGQKAISAVKVLALAADAGIPICVVTAGNLGDCSTLYQSSYLVAMMNLALTLGYEVVAPRDALTHHDWHGGGFIARDPVTKEGYWYIVEGGLNGGATVDDLDSWGSPWRIVFKNPFRQLCQTDPITANIIAPLPDSYWPVQKNLMSWSLPNPWNLRGLHPVFDVEYTICYAGGTSTTVPRQYVPNLPYPAGDQTFNAGSGTTASLDFTMFDVEVETTPDGIYVPLVGDPFSLHANVVPRMPPGATLTWSTASGNFGQPNAEDTTFTGQATGATDVTVQVTNANGSVQTEQELIVFGVTMHPQSTAYVNKGYDTPVVAPALNAVISYTVDADPTAIFLPQAIQAAAGQGLTTLRGELLPPLQLQNAWTWDGKTDAGQYVDAGSYTTRVEVIAPNGKMAVGTHTVNVVEVQSVEFFDINGNPLDDNAHPTHPGGKRVFPGRPTAGAARNNVVKVRATLNTNVPVNALPIYFRSYDVLDPTGLIDANTLDSVENVPAIGELSDLQPFADGDNTVEVDFKVTMQPGDNFKILASANSLLLQGIHTTTITTTMNITTGTTTDPALQPLASERLTVWRRVHVEYDSMGVVTGNFVTGTILSVVSTGITSTVTTDQNFFEPNSLITETHRFAGGQLIAAGNRFSVITNTHGSDLTIIVNNIGATVPVTGPFRLVDDDDFNNNDGANLDGDDGEDITFPETALISNTKANERK